MANRGTVMLGQRNLQVTSRQLVRINYENWLDCERGETLSSVTVTVIPVSTPATAATVDTISLTPNKRSVLFIIGGPGIVGDQFNVQVVVNTTLTQERTDLVGVTVVAVM
jgi:hypothetical protein